MWLTDYGLFPFREYRNHLGCGTPWDAPEVANPGMELKPVDKPADIFAFAMLVIEVFTGKKPFPHAKSDALACLWIMKGKRPPRPSSDQGLGFSDGIWDIIQRCWLQNADERPVIDDVVNAWEQAMRNTRWVP